MIHLCQVQQAARAVLCRAAAACGIAWTRQRLGYRVVSVSEFVPRLCREQALSHRENAGDFTWAQDRKRAYACGQR